MPVQYEWDCETVADGDSEDYEDGDVIDHAHGSSYADVLSWVRRSKPEKGTRYEIVLVRDDDEGRSWAYVTNGELPEFFTDADGLDAARVPQRFIKEVSRNG